MDYSDIILSSRTFMLSYAPLGSSSMLTCYVALPSYRFLRYDESDSTVRLVGFQAVQTSKDPFCWVA